MLSKDKRMSLPININKVDKTKNKYNKIKIFCRFKPLKQNLKNLYKINRELGVVEVEEFNIKNSNKNNLKKFIFSEILEEKISQLEVFNKVGLEIIDEIFEKNQDSLIFTYGVTNAGKTYTILGEKDNKGILYRILYKIFEIKQYFKDNDNFEIIKENETKYISKNCMLTHLEDLSNFEFHDINLSFTSYQVYNEEIYDLFQNKKNINQKLKIKENEGKIIIDGLIEKKIINYDDIENLISLAEKNRKVSSTGSNNSSSRSHTIYKLKMDFVYKNDIDYIVNNKNIVVIDLAGSERLKKTNNNSINLIEANNINKSLLVLGKCLKAMGNNQNIPFRESKLTRILSEFFKGDHLIRMIVNINPEPNDFEESLRVLDYSSIAREIKIITNKLQKKKISVFKTPVKTQKIFEQLTFADNDKTDRKEGFNNNILQEILKKVNNIEKKISNQNFRNCNCCCEDQNDLYYFSDLSTKEQIKLLKQK